MHWHMEPLILPILIAILLLLSIPFAHSQSAAIVTACDADVRRLCPVEYAAVRGSGSRKRHALMRVAVAKCMQARGSEISAPCVAAWRREHP